jgi:hypothetical protein
MILQLAAETFVRLIKIIILFTGGRTFVRESQLIQLTLGKNFCQDSPSSRGYAAGYPPPTDPRASPRCSSSSSWRRCSSQMQLTYLTAHLLDSRLRTYVRLWTVYELVKRFNLVGAKNGYITWFLGAWNFVHLVQNFQHFASIFMQIAGGPRPVTLMV